jgi:hypothetical protein
MALLAPSAPLSVQQLAHFNAFGLVVLRGYLSPEEQRQMAAEHEAALGEGGADLPCFCGSPHT